MAVKKKKERRVEMRLAELKSWKAKGRRYEDDDDDGQQRNGG